MKKLAAALTLIGAVIAGGTAHAQDTSYNNGNSRTPTVSATFVTPGGPFTVTVGCIVGETVVFNFQGATQSVVCANTALTEAESLSGTASATFNAPTAPGTYTGTVEFPAAPTETFSITVQAVPATTDPSGGGLPPTGSDGAGPTIMIASILLLAGVGMFGVAQRRRRDATATATLVA